MSVRYVYMGTSLGSGIGVGLSNGYRLDLFVVCDCKLGCTCVLLD